MMTSSGLKRLKEKILKENEENDDHKINKGQSKKTNWQKREESKMINLTGLTEDELTKLTSDAKTELFSDILCCDCGAKVGLIKKSEIPERDETLCEDCESGSKILVWGKNISMDLPKLTKDELIKLANDVKTELTRRNESIRNPINVFDQINTQVKDKLNRHNGGWTKTITGLDKTHTNGYSIIGEFVNGDTNRLRNWHDGLYLDCDIRGSRKRHDKYYTLYKIEDNAVEVVAETKGNDWAINLWQPIEINLLRLI